MNLQKATQKTIEGLQNAQTIATQNGNQQMSRRISRWHCCKQKRD